MRITVWGCCGSLPGPIDAGAVRRKIEAAARASRGVDITTEEGLEAFVDSLPFEVRGTYGGDTTCVQIDVGDEIVVCDAGSGLRNLSGHLLAQKQLPARIHILMTHLHWDHIQGFPFFAPAYIPGNRITIYGVHEETEAAFRGQESAPSFPVPFEALAADIDFVTLDPDVERTIAGLRVRMIEQDHPGRAYGYRFEREGKTFVLSTDSEHREEMERKDYPFIDFFRDADLLMFDAQYLMADAVSDKRYWGHSSNVAGVELAVRSGARHLCLCHHEHTRTDEEL